MDLSVQVEELAGSGEDRVVARVSGELDVSTAPRLREELVALFAAGRRYVVLDLSDLDFLDSTGLGVIVGVLKRARTLGGDLLLVCPKPSIRRVFEITGLDRTMPLSDTVDAALIGAEG